MSSNFQKAGEFLRDAAQESARQVLSDHRDRGHIRGFSSAAGIALRRIQEKLDAYREQMKGPRLSKPEQASYAQLDELKSQTEAEYDRYWRDTGIDWRPLKPVAKGTVKRAIESQSGDRGDVSSRHET